MAIWQLYFYESHTNLRARKLVTVIIRDIYVRACKRSYEEKKPARNLGKRYLREHARRLSTMMAVGAVDSLAVTRQPAVLQQKTLCTKLEFCCYFE